MGEKLIIWDFDGVVADTEKLWLAIELDMLNKYCGLNWDFATINRYLSGQGYLMQIEVLDRLGIHPPQEMWEKIGEKCYQQILAGFERTLDMEEVLSLPGFKHAMATGGMFDETILKLKAIGLEKVFTADNLVTVDMVKKGKPEPDSFLLAAEKSGVAPQDTFVIEDSIAGLTAAIRAGMTPIGFTGSEIYRHNAEHTRAVKALGVKYIFDNMRDIKSFLQNIQ